MKSKKIIFVPEAGLENLVENIVREFNSALSKEIEICSESKYLILRDYLLPSEQTIFVGYTNLAIKESNEINWIFNKLNMRFGISDNKTFIFADPITLTSKEEEILMKMEKLIYFYFRSRYIFSDVVIPISFNINNFGVHLSCFLCKMMIDTNIETLLYTYKLLHNKMT